MTKILHIPTGQYIKFLSSIEYDKTQANWARWPWLEVENVEDSFIFMSPDYADKSLENVINIIVNMRPKTYIPEIDKFDKFCESEFEIIYD